MAAHAPTDVEGEHRFLSVLFCDLAGSTGHQYRMETEDFAALLSVYRTHVFDSVKRHGGYLARVIGDGVLAYFGWPLGRGRDAEAAVSCALEIGEQIARLGEGGGPPGSSGLAVRMAVETGWVLVGHVGAGGSGDIADLERRDVVGHAPNVAARLQHLAPDNSVVVGEATLALIGNRFSVRAVDTSKLDLPAPIRAAIVTGRLPAAKALQWLGEGENAPFVGRESEMSRLLAIWQAVQERRGQVALISGGPGIGKSRLAANLLASLRSEGRIIVLTCSEAAIDTAFAPVADQLRSLLDLTRTASPVAIVDAVRRLAHQYQLTSAADGIAAVLGVASPHLPATALRQTTFSALIELTLKIAVSRPVLLLVEDLQWADASTLALLHQLGKALGTAPIMLVATHRADWDPEWSDLADVHSLPLMPLTLDSSSQLVEALAAGIPKALRAAIVERSEGIPFFIREFARAMGVHGKSPRRLPGSIAQLLAARLDGAGTARDLVQYTAALGQEIEPALLAELAGQSVEAIAPELDRLLTLEIMRRQGDGETVRFTFCHALLADAAYEALTTARRQALHAQIAAVLRSRNPAIGTTEPEVLGRHLALAGDAATAAALYHAAATNALRAAAFVESSAHARRSLELAETLSDEAGQRARLAAMVVLGEALSGKQGYASNEVYTIFEAANRIALDLGHIADLQPAMRGITAYYQIRGPLHRAHALGERLVQVARIGGDPLLLAEAERRWGWCRFCQGAYDEARVLVESAMQRLEQVNAARDGDPVIDDTAVRGPVILALIAWLVESEDRALEIADTMAEAAEQYPLPMTAVYGLGFASFVQQLCRRPEAARRLAERSGEIARNCSNPYWISLSDIVCGWSEVVGGGDIANGLQRLRDGLAEYERTQSTILYPYALMLLAEAENVRGEKQAALDALRRGLECAEHIGADFYRSVLEAARARILVDVDVHAARRSFTRAKTTAERQGATAHASRIDAAMNYSLGPVVNWGIPERKTV